MRHRDVLQQIHDLEMLIAEFARHSPGFYDDGLLVDSTRSSAHAHAKPSKRGGASSLTDALANPAD